jgi:hypothetical protein
VNSIARLLVIVCVFTTATACGGDDEKKSGGGSGDAAIQWLGTGGPCSDLKEVEADKQAKEQMGFMICNNAHKTFTGDMRCERDLIEVACRG